MRVALWALAAVPLLVVALVGAAAATLPACSACHTDRTFVRETRAGAHASVPCTTCHAGSGVAARIQYGYQEVFGMALRVVPGGRASAAVSDQTCLTCHTSVMSGVLSARGLRIRHSSCTEGSACSDCHAATAHGTAVGWQRSPLMEQCLTCHNNGSKASAACDTCHDVRTEQQRLKSGTFVVTHGPNWQTTHGMGDWRTCSACHAPTDCQKCHGIPLPHGADFMTAHGTTALTTRSSCSVCHQQSFCDSCHGLPMPHPAGFVPTHSKVVAAKGQAVCDRCHVQDDCTTCHVDHVHPGNDALTPPKTALASTRTTP